MYRVMIVDDWEIFLKQLKRKADFEAHGFTVVHEAPNGQEAFHYLLEHDVDLIITDIRMPGWDGIDLLKAMREASIETHVIFLSEYEDFQYAKQAIHYNITDYLVKPVNARELQRSLAALKQQLDQQAVRQHVDDEQIAAIIQCITLKQDALSWIQPFLKDLDEATDIERLKAQIDTCLEAVTKGILQRFPWYLRFQLPFTVTIDNKQALTDAMETIACPVKRLFYTSAKQPLIEKVCQFALTTDDKVTIKMIADALFVNKNYLADTFKKETGLTLGDYLIQVKIYRAKVLLLTTTDKLYEISDRLGYRNPEYFSRVFKKETGLTPLQFRDQA
ncbi:response regulator [Halolactibacillus sp. JCM 19043]|uniref:response regulator transcription factor n=1 Tax=Halolactibacillus sp. JCM 19043 TaxID=1460638 RepID=UPI00078262CD|nr:response regulator [Halolactibacillus sp. JCM 19043]